MSRRPRVQAAVAAAAIVIGAFGPHLPLALRAPLGVGLALVLPGVAIVAALFPRPTLTPIERLVLTPAAGLAALVLVGLGLHVVGVRLTPVSWSWAAAIVTAGAAAVAIRRHDPGAAGEAPAVTGAAEAPAGARRPPRERALSPGIVVIALVALVIAAAWSMGSAQGHDTASFSALWATARGTGAERTVVVGVRNQEGRPVRYRVEVADGDASGRHFAFDLADGRLWTSQLPAPEGRRVTVALFTDDRAEPYRSVFIDGSPS